jgi:hypothetical protein
VAEVRLTYQRLDDAYMASIEVDGRIVWGASKIPFAQMIMKLSVYLQVSMADRLVWRRTDRAALSDYISPPAELELVKKLPAEFLKATEQYDDLRVIVRDSQPVERVRVELRTGYDTLAEAFGENVYARFRDDGCIECPCCGRWKARLEGDHVIACECNERIYNVDHVGSWIEIPTENLLMLVQVPRFYLPRAWNISGPWVTHADLSRKFDIFNKESPDGR